MAWYFKINKRVELQQKTLETLLKIYEQNGQNVTCSDYLTDNVFPHSKGSKTIIKNGELLCSFHNQLKGNKFI